jgi:hypothetical protein
LERFLPLFFKSSTGLGNGKIGFGAGREDLGTGGKIGSLLGFELGFLDGLHGWRP